LGKFGLRVSELSLGSWISCDDLSALDRSTAIIHKAYDCGINFFDTADAYSEGRAEIVLGHSLRDFARDSYVLATKVYWPTGCNPNDQGLSRKHIMNSIDKSLQRLHTDHVDIYYCHWFDKTVPLDETLRAMDDIVRHGKALYIGVSNWTANQMGAGLAECSRYLLYSIAVNQPSYNMLDRYIEKSTMPFCEEHGIGLVVYSPLAQGMLSGKYNISGPFPEGSRAAQDPNRGAVSLSFFMHPECFRVVDELKAVAKDMGITMAQLALAWVLGHKQISSAIIGASRPEQVQENTAASDIVLPSDVRQQIDDILNSMQYTVSHNIID
jgi:aryl-alcohol dehydrogenase-like predicted oxidoreductase